MSLPWIKVYHTLPDHPKAEVLAELLQTPRAWTHVVELWLWAARVNPSGDLSSLSPESVARKAGWTGDAGVFITSLRKAGFLDGTLLHGWGERQSAHAARLAYDKARAKKNRENKRLKNRPTDVPSRPTNRPTDVRSLEGEGEGEGEVEGEKELSTKKPFAPFENPKVATREGKEVNGTEGQAMPVKSTPAVPGRKISAGMTPSGTPAQEIAPSPVSVDQSNNEQSDLFLVEPVSRPLAKPKPKPKREPPSAEWQAEQDDCLRWVEAARQVNGLAPEHARVGTATFMTFKRQRKAYGMEALMRSLDGLKGDAWAAKQGLAALLADSVIQKGLAAGVAHSDRLGTNINEDFRKGYETFQAIDTPGWVRPPGMTDAELAWLRKMKRNEILRNQQIAERRERERKEKERLSPPVANPNQLSVNRE